METRTIRSAERVTVVTTDDTMREGIQLIVRDANGKTLDYLVKIEVETGRTERLARDAYGRWILNAEQDAVERLKEQHPAPLQLCVLEEHQEYCVHATEADNRYMETPVYFHGGKFLRKDGSDITQPRNVQGRLSVQTSRSWWKRIWDGILFCLGLR